MTGEELLGGFRNALERGESLKSAGQTFLNAGYSANEVNEAIRMIFPYVLKAQDNRVPSNSIPALKSKLVSEISPKKNLQVPKTNPPNLQNNLKGKLKQLPQMPSQEKKSHIWIYIIIAIIVLAVAGFFAWKKFL